jgi:hypothetical protein
MERGRAATRVLLGVCANPARVKRGKEKMVVHEVDLPIALAAS